ncbi:MAG: hypothetical protein KDE59_08430 [Anaerolineales bacterium]|nr:hypothetical protein [Anaerolineales bacterium]
MNMKDVIANWFAWLKGATAEDNEQLAHVYSDGRQLWASNGYALHALDVALAKTGQVTVDEDGLFMVAEGGTPPPFPELIPADTDLATAPVTSIIISAEALREAAAGQEGYVRLNLYGQGERLELQSAGQYALLMPVTGMAEESFWRPH